MSSYDVVSNFCQAVGRGRRAVADGGTGYGVHTAALALHGGLINQPKTRKRKAFLDIKQSSCIHFNIGYGGPWNGSPHSREPIIYK